MSLISRDDDDDCSAVALSELISTEGLPPAKKAKYEGRRSIVNSVHLSTLMASYHNHFNSYCKDRKQSIRQIIPAKVWQLVYADYMKVHPESRFDQETLKSRTRETIEALQTGTANEKRGPATLQSEDFLDRIKNTNAHASRNVISLRQDILESSSSAETPLSRSKSNTQSKDYGQKLEKCQGKQASKGDLQKSQVAYLEKLSNDFADSTKNQKTYLQEKTNSAKLSNLKVLLEMGVITKDEFTEQAKAVVGLK
jgi:hypothetical protein